MCGIAGVVAVDGSRVEDQTVTAMVDTLLHRGPDARANLLLGPVGLGHARLSIIDLAGSPQPLSTPDGRYHVTFNGEILNYRALRDEIAYPYRTHGDTEVILALFATEGPAGVRRLRGQFAFAVHDTHTGETWLVRDRLGILPLYYTRTEGSVLFASEVKALRAVLPADPPIDQAALVEYLLHRSVPAPGTLWSGVVKVPPAAIVRIASDGTTTTSSYWAPPPPEEVLDLTDAAAVDLVERRLRDAVAEALEADVPVGAYLSGGVDSSLVVALAAPMVNGPFHTFCADFGDERHAEAPYARIVAERFGTEHHEVPVSATDFADLWADLTWHRDAPVSEPADIAVFRLAQAARREVKVVLSGEGSDELFGGYPKYRFAGTTSAAGIVPAAVRGPALEVVQRLLPARWNRGRIAARALSRPTAAGRAEGWFAPFTPREVEALLGRPIRREPPDVAHRDAVDLMTRLDLTTWLPDNLLERGDRMSMAASLELRPPFLDHRLVEDALRLPAGHKVRDDQTKWVLKQVANRHLPRTITERRKIGFKVPLDAWFREGLRDLSHDLLLGPDGPLRDIVDTEVTARLLRSHESGRRNEEIRIWTLLSLAQWAASRRPAEAPAVR